MAMMSASVLGGEYVRDWDAFIGQEDAKRQLLTAIHSAKLRGATLPHVLLASGVPGVGKTTLALLIAQEMGVPLKVVSGKVTVNDARIAVSTMEPGSILFYDEIHQAVQGGKANAEWLLHLLQDGCLPGPRGMEVMPKITVIGATTDVGKLPQTIIGRFQLRPRIRSYTENESVKIAIGMGAETMGRECLPEPLSGSCKAVASAASGSPRLMRSIWTVVRDIALVHQDNHDGRDYDITGALEQFGLTCDGLDDVAQRYLIALRLDFGGQAGKNAIQDALQEPGGLGETERLLVEKGLITFAKAGRVLTIDGIMRAGKLATERGVPLS